VEATVVPPKQLSGPKEAYFAGAATARKALPQLEDFLEIEEAALSDYSANIISLSGLAVAHGIKPIFLTQPALWKEQMSEEEDNVDWLGSTTRNDRRFRLPGAMSSRYLDDLNSRLMATCRKHDLLCLDLAAGYPRDLEHFYDSVHFNERGSELVARRVADFIMSIQQ
jgi:hypothetical protein